MILLACISCHKYDYKFSDGNTVLSDEPRPISNRREAVRQTWAQDVPVGVDFRFIVGSSPTPVALEPDVLQLDCPDSYEGLCNKLQAVNRYAFESGYDYLIKIDDDSYLYPERLPAVFPDYLGRQVGPFQNCPAYASGICYVLSRKAMEVIINVPLHGLNWCEDMWTGKSLFAAGIPLTPEPRFFHEERDYSLRLDLLSPDHNYIALHDCPPETMIELHRRKHQV